MSEGSSADWGASLEECQKEQRRLCAQPGLGARALGLRECDWTLWRIGREWLKGHNSALRTTISAPSGPDVYLATTLYPAGGHTALIGDFVRALNSKAKSAHLILTNVNGTNSLPLSEEIRSRTEIPAVGITSLEEGSLLDRLELLFAQLLTLRPGRLFLFHHPDDPLASVVAQPEIADQLVLVHHADRTPSLGLHVPGIQIIDLNPIAASMSRLLGLGAEWLPLAAPDPGARPPGFLRRGALVTASSGSPHKFTRDYLYGYAETVGVILNHTRGWHLHIGWLEEKTLKEIGSALRAKNLEPDRFIHVPWTQSVATCLWEHEVDLFLSSFPIDGARTKVEVMASATPYLGHSVRFVAQSHRSEIDPESGLGWRTWEDLAAILQRVADPALLKEHSDSMRLSYERMHHPRVFAQQLSAILAGEGGREDPSWKERDQRSTQGMLSSLTTAISQGPKNVTAMLEDQEVRLDARTAAQAQVLAARWKEDLGEQERRVAALREENRQLKEEVKELRRVQERWREGQSFRAKLRRWLSRP